MASRLVRFALIAFVCIAFLSDAIAQRRVIRIDGFGAWDEFAIGSSSCAGTEVGSTLVQFGAYEFSGRNDAAHLFDTYCQIPPPGAFNDDTFTYADEAGLRFFIGDNVNNAVTAIRYSFLDVFRFDSDPAASGFQWTFYTFPGQLTVVGLYGLESVDLDERSYISDGWTDLWNGSVDGYNGEYFCFQDSTFIGVWDGALVGDSPCLTALQRLFGDGFEPAP